MFLGWLVDNQMWGRAAMLVEEMGDEWGRAMQNSSRGGAQSPRG